MDEAATYPHSRAEQDGDVETARGFKKPERDDDEDIELEPVVKKEQERDLSGLFIDPKTKEPFNPEKKFGIIESNSLIYDNVTTSYPLNLPTDYY